MWRSFLIVAGMFALFSSVWVYRGEFDFFQSYCVSMIALNAGLSGAGLVLLYRDNNGGDKHVEIR